MPTEWISHDQPHFCRLNPYGPIFFGISVYPSLLGLYMSEISDNVRLISQQYEGYQAQTSWQVVSTPKKTQENWESSSPLTSNPTHCWFDPHFPDHHTFNWWLDVGIYWIFSCISIELPLHLHLYSSKCYTSNTAQGGGGCFKDKIL